VKAFTRGILDYPAIDQRDWKWWLKEDLALAELEDEQITEMNRLSHMWHCSAAQVTGWDEKEDLFNHHKRQAHHAYNVIGKAILPWYKSWRSEEITLGELWRRFKEQEKDPAYAAELARDRERLRQKVRDTAAAQTQELEIAKARREADKQRELAAKARRPRRVKYGA
jgi:hypothetical protein